MDSIRYHIELLFAAKRELIRHRFFAVALSTVVLAVVVIVANKWPQIYRSSAVISLDHTNVIEPLLRGAAEVSEAASKGRASDVLTSRRVLERVATLRAEAEGVELTPEQLQAEVMYLARGLSVSAQGRGDKALTSVSFSSHDPSEAYSVVDILVSAFMKRIAEEKNKDTYEAYSFIDAQVKKYKKQLEEADEKLKAFKAGSVDVTEASVKARIANLTAQIKDLTIALEETQETMSATSRQLKSESRFLAERTQVIALEERKALLSGQLDRLRLAYQEEYPDIVTLKAQIAEIEREIQEKLTSVGGAGGGSGASDLPLYEELRKQYAAAELNLSTQTRRLKALEKLLEEEEKLADIVAENQAELSDLTRGYDVTRRHYEEMLARKENAKLTMELNDEGQGENYKLIQPPVYPLSPEGLNPLLIFLAAPVLALLAPLGIACAYVLFDPRVRSAEKLKDVLPEGVELLAIAPHQGTPLSVRLLKKDMLILGFWMLFLGAAYSYFLVSKVIGVE